ncbi:hypothetical protein niasHS_009279 [Heterodera schachtii]|uniref:Uncharacterized protein n=1 Tax=Heterodera schachtii TaxID=97005 RepID=A0ABD2IXW4_HETSC
MLFKDTKLKIFTTDALNGTNMTQSSADVGADVVENICVKSYTDKNEDQNGQRIKGIKDLIDEQDNYFMIEFLKYEMENATDPLVFSISSSVHASHLLLRLQSFSYLELRYLIKRLAYSLYFPYWVQHDQQENEVIYVSLVKKYSMDNYLFDNKIVYSNWTRI